MTYENIFDDNVSNTYDNVARVINNLFTNITTYELFLFANCII